MPRYRQKKKIPFTRFIVMTLITGTLFVTSGVLLMRNPSPEELFDSGKRASKNGDYALALQYLDKALVKMPDNAEVFEERAKANERLKRFDAALKNYEELRRLRPSDSDIINSIGWVQLQRGDHQGAIDHFDEGSRRFPSRATQFEYNKGRVYYDWAQLNQQEVETQIRAMFSGIGRSDKAREAALLFARDLSGNYPLDKVLAELPPGVMDEQRDLFLEEINMARDHTKAAHESLSRFYYSTKMKGQYGELLTSLDYHGDRHYHAKLMCELMLKALTKKSEIRDRVPILKLLANIHTEVGRPDLSAQNFEEIRRIYTKGKRIPRMGARRMELLDRLDAGDYKNIVKQTQRRYENQPKDVMNAYLYATAMFKTSKLKESLQVASSAVTHVQRGALSQFVPTLEEKLKVLWGFYEILNVGKKHEEARRMLDFILAIEPTNIDALEKRGRSFHYVFHNYNKAADDYFDILQNSSRNDEIFAAWEEVNKRRLSTGGKTVAQRIEKAASRWERFRGQPLDTDSEDYRKRQAARNFVSYRSTLVWELENDAYMIYRLALRYLEHKDVEEALLLLEKLTRRFPNVEEFPFKLAQIAYAQHQYEDALLGLEIILEKNPADADAATYAARCLRHVGRYDEAAEVEAKLILESPEIHGRILAIRKAFEQGDIDRAASIIRAGRKAHPENLQFRALHGHVLIAHDQWDKAQALFRLNLAKDPYEFDSLRGAILAAAHKDEAESLEQLVAMIKDAPHGVLEDDVMALGELMAEVGFQDLGVRFLAEARTRFPYSKGLVGALGRVRCREENLERAETLLGQVRHDDPSDPSTHMFLIHLANSGMERAARFLQDAKGRLDGEASMPSVLAACHAARGAYREAHSYLQRCRELGLQGEPHDRLMVLARALIAVNPLKGISGLPDELGGVLPPDELSESGDVRDRDFDWLVALGLQDRETLNALAIDLMSVEFFGMRPEFQERALESARKAYVEHPECGLAGRTLARITYRTDDEQGARDILLGQLRSDPSDERSLAMLVDYLVQSELDAESLLAEAEAIHEIVGLHPAVRTIDAHIAEIEGEISRARKHLEYLARQTTTSDAYYRLRLARLYASDRNPIAARRLLLAAFLENPRRVETREALVAFWKEFPHVPRLAAAKLLPVLRKDPFLFDLYPGVVGDFSPQEMAKHLPDLESWLTSATKNQVPLNSLEALAAVGRALVDTGRLDKAKVLLERARSVDPAHPVVLEALGDIAYAQGAHREAASTYGLVEILYTASTEVRSRLATLWFNTLGERDKGAALAELVVKEARTPVPEAYHVLAEWDYLQGRPLAAAATLEHLLNVTKANIKSGKEPREGSAQRLANLHYRIGLMAYTGSHPKTAIPHLQWIADENNPDHPGRLQAQALLKRMNASLKKQPKDKRIKEEKANDKTMKASLTQRRLVPEPKKKKTPVQLPQGPIPDQKEATPSRESFGPSLPTRFLAPQLAPELLGPRPGETDQEADATQPEPEVEEMGPPVPTPKPRKKPGKGPNNKKGPGQKKGKGNANKNAPAGETGAPK